MRKEIVAIEYWGLAILIAALYIILSYFTPIALDDYVFMGNWRDDCLNTGFSMQGWVRFFKFQGSYDNVRIANLIDVIVCQYSPWKEIFPFATGLLVAFSAVALQKLGAGVTDIKLLVATWAMMIVGLPWMDTLFVPDYSLNYIWSGALTIAFLWLLRLRCRKSKGSPWLSIAVIVLALLAGGWHESFSICTLCGLGLFALFRRFRLPGIFYIAIGFYVVSTLFFMLSPGMINRIATSVKSPIHHTLFRNYFILLLDLCLLAGCLATARGRKALREFAGSDISLVAAGIIISGYVIAMTTVNTVRSFYWPNMAAICVGVKFTAIILDTWPVMIKNRWVSSVSAWILGLICVAQTTAVILWQVRYKEENDRLIALIEKTEGNQIYYDLTLPSKTPFYTLGIPTSGLWTNQVHIGSLDNYYQRELEILPTALRPDSIRTEQPVAERHSSTGTAQ